MPESTHPTARIDDNDNIWKAMADGRFRLGDIKLTVHQLSDAIGDTREVVLVPADEWAALTAPLPDDAETLAAELRTNAATCLPPEQIAASPAVRAADLIERQARQNRALWDRTSHDVWDDITRALGIDDYQAPADEIIAAIKRYREHSVTLNTIGWRVAQALGDVPDGATEIAGNPTGQIERLIVDRDHLRSLVQLRDAKFAEVRQERDHLAAENAEMRRLVKAWRVQFADLTPDDLEAQRERRRQIVANALNQVLHGGAFVSFTIREQAARAVVDALDCDDDVYTMTAPAPELPGMWEVADLVGGQTDAQPDGRQHRAADAL